MHNLKFNLRTHTHVVNSLQVGYCPADELQSDLQGDIVEYKDPPHKAEISPPPAVVMEGGMTFLEGSTALCLKFTSNPAIPAAEFRQRLQPSNVLCI